MYNYDGIHFSIFISIFILGLGGLTTISSSYKKIINETKDKDKYGWFIFGFICLCSVLYFLYLHYSIFSNVKIENIEGKIKRYKQSGPEPFKMEIVLESGDRYFTDLFTIKKIYREQLIIGEEYKLYYEPKSNIIVRIEKEE